jgi:hypothetical protein
MQQIIRHLFQADSLEDVPRERLEAIVQEHPCFGMGHYLLSRKLVSEGGEVFLEKANRANLYFSNPLWFHWLLKNDHSAPSNLPTLSSESLAAESLPTESLPAEEMQTMPAAGFPQEPAHETEPARIEEPIRDEEPPFVLDEMQTAEAATSEETAPSAADPAEHREYSAADQLLQNIEKAHELRQSLQRVNQNLEEVTVRVEREAPPPPPLAQVPTGQAGSPEPAMAAPATALPEVHVFEPYHTIDYFASQGIKLTLEDNPPDKLGKQLKSFTEWLKVMRRLPQKENELVSDTVSERNIQTIAAHSIEGREIVTETMAEVLVKQGKLDRAADMYRKLSLLNPDKSSYFAAKIEQLNIQ